jgi:hypothetical protein
MKPLLIVALLAALLLPIYFAQQTEQDRTVPYAPVRAHHAPRAPHNIMRITVIRFAVPPQANFTPPVVGIGEFPPRDMLKAYAGAALLQNITPIIHAFPPFAVTPGQTKGLTIGNPPTASLVFTPARRANGTVKMNIRAEDITFIDDSQVVGGETRTVTKTAGVSLKLDPGRVVLLPPAFNNRLNDGLLFVSVTGAAGSKRVPVKIIAPLAAAPAVSPGKPTLYVQITDADVPASYVPSITHAMSDAKTRTARLAALTQDADTKGRALVILHGVHTVVTPAAPTAVRAAFPVNPAPETLEQTLTVAGRINPNKTAAVNLTLSEYASDISPKTGAVVTLYSRQISAKSLAFYSGQTKLLDDYIQSANDHHLVFATIAVVRQKTK